MSASNLFRRLMTKAFRGRKTAPIRKTQSMQFGRVEELEDRTVPAPVALFPGYEINTVASGGLLAGKNLQGLTVDPNSGNIYLANNRFGSGFDLYRVTPTGSSALVGSYSIPQPGLVDLEWGPDNNIYVIGTNGNAYNINPSTGVQALYSVTGIGLAQYGYEFDPAGNLIVTTDAVFPNRFYRVVPGSGNVFLGSYSLTGIGNSHGDRFGIQPDGDYVIYPDGGGAFVTELSTAGHVNGTDYPTRLLSSTDPSSTFGLSAFYSIGAINPTNGDVFTSVYATGRRIIYTPGNTGPSATSSLFIDTIGNVNGASLTDLDFGNGTYGFTAAGPSLYFLDDSTDTLYESRLAATMSATLAGGTLTVADGTSLGKNNSLSVRVSGSNLIITDAAQQFLAAPSGGTLSNGNKTLTIPLGSVNALVVNTGAGSDTLTLDYSGGALPAVSYDGGSGGSDTLRVVGTGLSAVYTPSASTFGNGSLAVAGNGTINFFALEPVDFDVTGGTFTLNLPGANDSVNIANGTLIGGGSPAALVISGTSGGVAFENARVRGSAIVIDTTAVAGTDTVTIASANNAHTNTSLQVLTGSESGDQILVNGPAVFGSSITLTTGGSILDGNATGTDLTAPTIALTGGVGIGIGTNFTLEIDATTVTASSAAGDVALADANTATIGAAGLNAGSSLFLDGGTFVPSGNNQINPGNFLFVNPGATLNLNGFSDTIGQLGLFGSATAAGAVQTGAGSLQLTNIFVGLTGLGGVAPSVTGNLNLGGATRNVTVSNGNGAVDFVLDAALTNGGVNYVLNGSAGAVVTASGASTYTGSTTIGTGLTLRLTAAGVIPDASAVTVNGTLDLNSNSEATGMLTGSGAVALGSGTLTVNASGGVTYSGSITGTGGLTVTGGGNLILSGTGFTYSGLTTVSNGAQLELSAGATPGNTAGATVVNGGTLKIGHTTPIAEALSLQGDGIASTGALTGIGGASATGPITLTGNASIGTRDTAGTFTVSGSITETGGSRTLTLRDDFVGAHVLRLSGANAYTGGTVVNANVSVEAAGGSALPDVGTVALNSVSTLTLLASETIGALSGPSNATVNLNANALTTGDATNTTFAGVIGGTGGGLTKQGAGLLTLTGANTYTGATSVTGGRLNINGSVTSNVAVNGGTLGGTGTIGSGNTLTLNSGTVAPGTSPGVLNSGSVTFTGGTFQVEVNGPAVGTQYDQLNVTGTVALGAGTTALSLPTPTFAAGNTYTIINNDGTDNVTGYFTGLPEGALVGTFGVVDVYITYAGGSNNNDVQLLTTPTINGTSGGDQIVLRLATTPTGTYEVSIDGGTTFANLGAITALTVNGLGGNDTLTIDGVNGNPFPTGGVTFNGGNQTDALRIVNVNGQATTTYNYTNPTDGSVVISNFGTVTYTGLAPITNTGTAANVVFNLPGAGSTVTLGDDGTTGNGRLRLSSTPTAFELTDFLAPTVSLTLNRGNAADTLSVADLTDFAATANLALGASGAGFTSIDFAGPATANNLTAFGTGITSSAGANVTANGSASFTGNTITLGTAGVVNFNTLTFAATGAVTVAEGSSTTLAGTSTANSLVLTSTALLTNAASASLTVTNNASFTGTSIDLGTQTGDTMNFGSLTVNSAGTATVSENSNTVFNGLSTVASLVVTATGNITDDTSGDLAVAGLASFTANGTITLGNDPGNDTNFGSLTVSNTGAVNVTEDSATAVNTVTGTTVSLTSAGAISDNNGAALNLTATTATLAAAGGIDLDTALADLTATTSAAGAVLIDELNAITLTNVSTADGNITVTAGGTVTAVSVTDTLDASHVVSITTTAGDILVGLVQANGDTVTLDAAGAIEEFGSDAAADVIGGVINLTAAAGIGAAGTVEINTITTAARGLTAHVTGTGPIDLSDTAGGLRVRSATTANGPVTIAAVGDMVVETVTAGAAAAVNLSTTASGSILDDDNDATRITAGAVTLTAVNTIGAPLATGAEDLDTDAATVDASTSAAGANNGIWITDVGAVTFGTVTTADGVIVLDAATGLTANAVTAGGTGRNVRLRTTTSGDIALGVVTAAGDSVLVSAVGAVTDNNAAANNVDAASLNAVAGAGVGTAGNAIETTVSNLAASGGTGGVFVTNAGDLTVASLTTFGVATNGATGVGVTVSTTQNLTVSAPVSAGTGAARLLFAQDGTTAGRTATVNAPVTGNTATLTGGAGGDTVTVNAMGATDLTLNGGGGADQVTVNTEQTAGAPGFTGAGAVFLTDAVAGQSYTATVRGAAAAGGDIFDVNDVNQSQGAPAQSPGGFPVTPVPAITTATGPATVATNGTKALDYAGTAGLTVLNLVATAGTNTYNVQFVDASVVGSKLPPVVNIQTGTTADTANLYGTAATDTIDVGFTTAGTASSAGRSVTYPQSVSARLAALNVYGRGEPNTPSPAGPAAVGDTFRVFPDAFTPVNIFAGLPTDGYGDTLILNAFGLTNPAVSPIGGAPNALPNGQLTSSNRRTVTWNSVETLPVPLGLGGTFDFQPVPSPTQFGFLPVTPSDTPTSGAYAAANVGWLNPGAGAVDRLTQLGPAALPNSPGLSTLLRTLEWGYAGGGANNGRFQVTVAPNQPVQVTTQVGDTFAGRDRTNVYVTAADPSGNPIAGTTTRLNPSVTTFDTLTPDYQYVSYSGVFNPGSSSTLIVTFETTFGGASSFWTVGGLDVRPLGLIAPLVLSTAAVAPREADGLTVDPYTGTGAAPFATLTVSPQNGTPVGTDADPAVKGFQVRADARGNFTFDMRRGTGSGPDLLTVTDVTGASGTGAVGPTAAGSLAVSPSPFLLPTPYAEGYTLPAARRIDFGPAGSPAAPGYVPLASAAYASPAANALGWLGTAPVPFDRGPAAGPLLRDGVSGTPATPGDFLLDVPAANAVYSVTAALGDAQNPQSGMFVQVLDPTTGGVLATPVSGLGTPAGQTTSATFAVTSDANGKIRLRFGTSVNTTNSFWTLQGLEVRPQVAVGGPAGTQVPLTLNGTAYTGASAGTGSAFTATALGGAPVAADGTTATTYTVTGATPNALLTVSATLGTVSTADGASAFTGLQVQANGSGAATFVIVSPLSTSVTSGTVTVTDVTGAALGVFTQNYSGYTPPLSPPAAVVQRFDFNSGASPTEAGFTGVQPSAVYTPTAGFGWRSAVNGYDRGAAGAGPAALFQDGAWGTGSGTFQVGVAAGAARDVRVYVGDPYQAWSGITVRVEGNATPVAVNESVMRYGFVTLSGFDQDGDGRLDVTVSGPVWVVSGLDAATPGALPAPATPAATALPVGGARLQFAGTAIPGYTAVPAATTYTPALGYGWAGAVNAFARPASMFPANSPLTAAQMQFYGSGAWGQGAATFAVAVPLGNPSATYTVRGYVADPYMSWSGITLTGEGGATGTATASVDPPASITLIGLRDVNGDGVITVTVSGQVWVLNGLDVINGTLPAAPQLAAATAGPGADAVPALTAAELAPVVRAAVARWEAAGVTAEQAARLRAVTFTVGDLSGYGALGLAPVGGTAVTLDATAAGFGWFVDPTPLADEEFALSGSFGPAVGGAGAAGRYDLLTVVAHELGHVLGLDTLPAGERPDDLMGRYLGTGVRRLPAATATPAVDADPLGTGAAVPVLASVAAIDVSGSAGITTVPEAVPAAPALPTGATSVVPRAVPSVALAPAPVALAPDRPRDGLAANTLGIRLD